MFLQYIMLFVILMAGVLAFSIRFYYKKKEKELRAPKVVLLLGIVLVVVFGFVLTPILYFQLNEAVAVSKWPSVDGAITSSKVIGGRAYRPDIRYDYYVDGSRFTGSSYLNSPGFGGRMNRLDAAEKLVHLNPVGKSITVYYNPDNNAESTLTPHPTFSNYLKLGTSAFLLWLGMTILFIFGQRPGKQPIYKERT